MNTTTAIRFDGTRFHLRNFHGVTHIRVLELCQHLGLKLNTQLRKLKGMVTLELHRRDHFMPASSGSALSAWLDSLRVGRAYTQRFTSLQAGLYEAVIKTALYQNATETSVEKVVEATGMATTGKAIIPSMVPFLGSHLYVVSTSKDDWVVVPRVCELLGMNPDVARRYLLRQSWTWTTKMVVQLPGQPQGRQLFMLNRRRFGMWMATLNADLVSDDSFLPVLKKFQCEAADVLDAWSNKRRALPALDLPDLVDIKGELTEVTETLQMLVKVLGAQQELIVQIISTLKDNSVPLDKTSVVLPMVVKSDSYSGQAVVKRLIDNAIGVPHLNVNDDKVVREIACALGFIDDPKYGFWNALANQTGGKINESWRFFTSALDNLDVQLTNYASLCGTMKKADALKTVVELITRVGVGKGTHLSRNHHNRLVNGHKMTNGPQLRTPQEQEAPPQA